MWERQFIILVPKPHQYFSFQFIISFAFGLKLGAKFETAY